MKTREPNGRTSEKAVRLARFIVNLNAQLYLSASKAKNMLDRLAIRMENAGLLNTAEHISRLFMQCR